MKNFLRVFLFSGMSLAAIRAQVAPPSSGSETKGDDVVQLSPFEISGSQDKGYLAGNSVSATRISTPVADLPFAISTFTPQIIVDTRSTDLYDIVRYASGVSAGGSGFNNGNARFSIRGFGQSPQHDGFFESPAGNANVDTVGVERVEVIKGPASLLYGQIAPGGTVNYISKRPQTAAFANVTLSGGSYDYARATVDLNQPIAGKSLLFRVNAAYENGFEWKKLSSQKTAVLVPSVTWNITPNVSLKINYQRFKRDEEPTANFFSALDVSTPASVAASFNSAAGNPAPAAALVGKTGPDAAAGFNDAGDPGYARYYPRLDRRYNSSSATDYRTTNLQTLNTELDFYLGRHWVTRANFNYNNNQIDQYQTGVANAINIAPPDSLVFANGTWSVSPTWTAMTAARQLDAYVAFAKQLIANPNAAFQLQNGTEAPVVNPRRPRQQLFFGQSRAAQLEAAGDYDFGWMKLKPLAGLFWDVAYQNNYVRQNVGSAASPNFRVWDVNPNSPTFYINQNEGFIAPAALTSVNLNTLAFTSDQAAYGVLNGSFFQDRLFVVGGLRYNRSQSQTTNYIAPAGTSPVGQGAKPSYSTPQAGFGYKPVPGILLYASYSKSYTLPASSFTSSIQNVNGTLLVVPTGQAAPTTGEGYDVGIKSDLMNGKLSSTLSLYQITQTNVVVNLAQSVNGVNLQTAVQGNAIRGRGVEYEVTWSPLSNLQVFASVSQEDIRNTAEPSGYAFYLGAHPVQTVKTLGNLWTRYSFNRGPLKNFWVGGGFNYTGKAAQDSRNPALFTPAYTLINSAAGYDWSLGKTKMSANLNWQNMANKVYQPAQAIAGLPSRVVLSVSAQFK